MVRNFTLTLAVLALPFAAIPAMAQSEQVSKGLNCMDNSYTPQQHERMAVIGPAADFGDGQTFNAEAQELTEIAGLAVQSCVASRGWSTELAMFAAFYELGRVNEIAYRASGAISPEILANIDAELANGNRDRLWQAIERSLGMGFAGGDITPETSDSIVMGAFVMGATGANDQQTAMDVGLLLGWMGLRRMGAREFAALQ